MSAFLDALIGRIFIRDTELPLGAGLNLKAPLTGTLNASTKLVDIELEDASLTPAKVAAVADSISVPFLIGPIAFAAGTPGTADDVTILVAAPFDFQIVDVLLLVSTEIGGSTVQLRDTAGGAGSVLSSALSSAATGTVRNNDTETRDVAEDGLVTLRRSDRGVAGQVMVWAVRT